MRRPSTRVEVTRAIDWLDRRQGNWLTRAFMARPAAISSVILPVPISTTGHLQESNYVQRFNGKITLHARIKKD